MNRYFLSFLDLLRRARSVQLSVLDQVMFNSCNAITTILVARGLGPHMFGEYIFIWGLVISVVTLQWAFLISPMTTIGPKQDIETAHYYYGAVFLTQLLSSMALFIIVWLGLFWQSNPIYHQMALPMAAASSLYSCQEFIRRYFYATGAIQKVFITDILGSASQVLLLIFFLWRHWFDVELVLWIVAWTSLASILWGVLNAGKLTVHHQHVKKTFKRNWNFGSWTILSTIIVTLATQAEVILIKLFLGAAALGGIRVVTILGNLFVPLLQGIQNILVPKAGSILEKSGESALLHYLWRTGFVITLLSLTVLVPVCIFRSPLIALIYGKVYLSYANFVILQAICCFINVIRTFSTWLYLQALEQVKFIFILTTTTNVLYIGLLAVLIHYFQVQGAFMAYITNASMLLIGSVLYVFYLFKTKRLFWECSAWVSR